MDKHESHLRQLISDVRDGQLPRRSFIAKLVGMGLSAPMASMLLTHAGVAQAEVTIPYKGTKRGGGGTLSAPLDRDTERALLTRFQLAY